MPALRIPAKLKRSAEWEGRNDHKQHQRDEAAWYHGCLECLRSALGAVAPVRQDRGAGAICLEIRSRESHQQLRPIGYSAPQAVRRYQDRCVSRGKSGNESRRRCVSKRQPNRDCHAGDGSNLDTYAGSADQATAGRTADARLGLPAADQPPTLRGNTDRGHAQRHEAVPDRQSDRRAPGTGTNLVAGADWTARSSRGHWLRTRR